MTRLAAAFCALAWLLFAVPALCRGWVEKTVESDSTTVDLERDGTAVVAHEVLMRIRGGPLAEFEVGPVDADADLLEGATVTRAEAGRDAGFPIPLASAKDGTRATLHVQGIKGIRSGTYQLRFRYKTNLGSASKIRVSATGAAVEFSGLSFPDGIDSARVVFRIPRAAEPPRLPLASDTGQGAEVAEDDQHGVFLSTVRRGADKDEIEVVRPHVAKGEIVDWRVVADRASFDLVTAADAPVEPEAAPTPKLAAPPTPIAEPGAPILFFISALGLLYAGVTALKSRWVRHNSKLRAAVPRPLLPLSIWLRAFIAGMGVFAAALCLSNEAPPAAFAACLAVAMIAAAHLPPRGAPPLRGPGAWKRLSPEVAFDEGPPEALAGRFADVGTGFGFLAFVALLGGFVAVAITAFHRSAYDGLGVALGASLLFPIFCTGRVSELPRHLRLLPLEFLDALFGELERVEGIEFYPAGRVPHGGAEFDEVRLFVLPKRPVPGLVGIEVGLDAHPTLLGPLELPFVIVRVHEGSKSETALPAGLLWTRGRSADERVTVLRPKLPTRALTLRLVRELCARLGEREDKAKRAQASTSATRSAGNSSSTAKPGTRSSPAHAT